MPAPSLFRSRLGLRLLALFVLAAAVPLLLLSLLAQQAVGAALARSQGDILSAAAKTTGLQTLDRLRRAQALLQDLAADAAIDSPALLAVVEIDGQGRRQVVRNGPGVATLGGAALATAGATRLLVIPDSAGLPSVVLRGVGDAGRTRLGLVNPAFLWDRSDELPAGLWLCALDDLGRALHCSDEAMAARAAERLAARPVRGSGSVDGVRGLFLAADFAARDWQFVAGFDDSSAEASGSALRDHLPVAAAAALALALLLALVQLRRTMTPLQALVAGAERIARREVVTPLPVTSRDEFADLAAAFNHMTERIEGQFAELESLAEIDREIVGGAELRSILARIVVQLRQVLPAHALGLAHLPGGEGQRLECVVAGPSTPTPRWTSLRADPVLLARLGRSDDWLALDGEVEVPELAQGRVWPLRRRERCYGFLALGPGPAPDADELRQLLELRNRAAIAIHSADRERALVHAAEHDPVTGLLNRHGLDAALARLLAAVGPDQPLALLFLDLDRFKAINDNLGHAAGDQALRQAAMRVGACLPRQALAARPAGDEFVMLLPGIGHTDAAATLARSLCDVLAQPMIVGGALFYLRASVGVALCNDPAESPEGLLRRADLAMYEAKRAGGGRVALADQRLDEQWRRRAWIETDLPLAAERSELSLVYQPRLARDGRLVGLEALIRWQHPLHGACPPGEFIAVAEQSVLIEHIGLWVIGEVCAQVRAWRDGGLAPPRVAINLSARQIGSERLLPDLQAALAAHGLRGEDFEVEITEGLLVEQTDATLERLRALRRLGLSIALDDFGTGFSSMAYLRSLPIDVLKIDRAFVKDIAHDASALAVARAIVALATSLGMRTVAEGVETPQQREVLETLRCDEVQGFLFSPPLPPSAIEPLLQLAATAPTAERLSSP